MSNTTSRVPVSKIIIDFFRPEDAAGVSACYRAIYGDQFPVAYVYDPDQVAARNAGDDHHTVIARTPEGEVIGLIGMFRGRANKHVYEIGQLMVRDEYRSTSIAVRLYTFILKELPPKIDIHVLYGEALCSHVVSQKMSFSRGLHTTGLELDVMPVSVSAVPGKEIEKQRGSLLLMFSIYHDTSQKVYLPAKHADFCTMLYKRLGAQRTILPTGNKPDLQTTANYEWIPDLPLLSINITAIGSDLADYVQKLQDELTTDAPMVHIHLRLDDPGVEAGCAALEEAGFFVSGLLPLWFGVDGLLLQRIPWSVDFSSIQLVPGEAEEVGNWVQTNLGRVCS